MTPSEYPGIPEFVSTMAEAVIATGRSKHTIYRYAREGCRIWEGSRFAVWRIWDHAMLQRPRIDQKTPSECVVAWGKYLASQKT